MDKIFHRNEARRKINKYCASVCGKCKRMCCAYNTTPISGIFSLEDNLAEEDMIILKKALVLDRDFRKRFRQNVKRSLSLLERKGFWEGGYQRLKEGRYSISTFIEIYMEIDKRIGAYNEAIYREDKYDLKGRTFHDCFFLLPGKGCILEEYRPSICKIAFRECFRLRLFEYVEANLRRVTPEALYRYILQDFKIDPGAILPKIIIGAGDELKRAVQNLLAFPRISVEVGGLSYFQIAKLGDFLAYPFPRNYEELEAIPDFEEKFFERNVKNVPTFNFIDKIERGKKNNAFGFGLDYVQAFLVVTEFPDFKL